MPPLKSQAQAGWLKANKPELFKKFVEHTPKGTHLPKRVKPKKKGK